VQPDPLVQDPNNIQNLNRYSYVVNNPLKYIDPSGYDFRNPYSSVYAGDGTSIISADGISYYNGGTYNDQTIPMVYFADSGGGSTGGGFSGKLTLRV
jgi:hypothetical protein